MIHSWDPYIKSIKANRLIEILLGLPSDVLVVPNDVMNLALYRPTMSPENFIGYIDTRTETYEKFDRNL